MAIHCVRAQTLCMNGLSLRTPPFVKTFAIEAISPNASRMMDRLGASSRIYRIAASSFSIEGNLFTDSSFLLEHGSKKDDLV